MTVDLGADGLTVTEFRPRLKKAPTASPDPAARRRAHRASMLPGIG